MPRICYRKILEVFERENGRELAAVQTVLIELANLTIAS